MQRCIGFRAGQRSNNYVPCLVPQHNSIDPEESRELVLNVSVRKRLGEKAAALSNCNFVLGHVDKRPWYFPGPGPLHRVINGAGLIWMSAWQHPMAPIEGAHQHGGTPSWSRTQLWRAPFAFGRADAKYQFAGHATVSPRKMASPCTANAWARSL